MRDGRVAELAAKRGWELLPSFSGGAKTRQLVTVPRMLRSLLHTGCQACSKARQESGLVVDVIFSLPCDHFRITCLELRASGRVYFVDGRYDGLILG